MSNVRIIDIARLDPAERLRLIEELWESLSADENVVELTEAQRAELDRRLDAIDLGDESGVGWAEVLARLQNPEP